MEISACQNLLISSLLVRIEFVHVKFRLELRITNVSELLIGSGRQENQRADRQRLILPLNP
jgi:hypothetical protein